MLLIPPSIFLFPSKHLKTQLWLSLMGNNSRLATKSKNDSRLTKCLPISLAFQVALAVKDVPINARDTRQAGWIPQYHPWVGKIPWRGKWQPTPVFLPGKFYGQEEPGRQQFLGSQTQTWLTTALISIKIKQLIFSHFKPLHEPPLEDWVAKETKQNHAWSVRK